MSASTENWPGRVALMVAHCAGMVDLVALPVWVGALIADYKFDPPHAGGLATLFLVGAVVSSLFFASRFNRIPARLGDHARLWRLPLSLSSARRSPPISRRWRRCTSSAGASVGCALSFTHGTIGRSANPHRLFAIVGLALGVFAHPVPRRDAEPDRRLRRARACSASSRVVMAIATIDLRRSLFPAPRRRAADAGLRPGQPSAARRLVRHRGRQLHGAYAGHDVQLPRTHRHRSRLWRAMRSLAC